MFVGCIPGNTVASELLELFNKYVPVESVSLALDTNSDLTEFCLGYGFAVCQTRAAIDFLVSLSGKITYRNRQITLREYKVGSRLKHEKSNFNRRRLFIGDIPSRVAVSALRDIFSQFGPLSNLYLVDQSTSQPLKYGYAIFQHENAATLALKECRNFELEGRKIRVEAFTGRKETGSHKSRTNQVVASNEEKLQTEPAKKDFQQTRTASFSSFANSINQDNSRNTPCSLEYVKSNGRDYLGASSSHPKQGWSTEVSSQLQTKYSSYAMGGDSLANTGDSRPQSTIARTTNINYQETRDNNLASPMLAVLLLSRQGGINSNHGRDNLSFRIKKRRIEF